MPIGGFLGGLANLGTALGGAQQYQGEQQRQAYSQALAELAIQHRRQELMDLARQRQMEATFGAATKGLDIQNLFGSPGAQLPQLPSPIGQPSVQPEQLPQVPPAGQQMAQPSLIGTPERPGLIPMDESGGRNVMQGVVPVSQSHASGPLQIQPGTYNRYAGAAGAQPLGPGELAMNRPVGEQYRVGGAIYRAEGAAPWADFNPKLAADLQKLSPEQQQQVDTGSMMAAGNLPPQMVGRAGPGVFAQLVQRIAGGDAPDDIKGAILLKLLPLMSQEGQQQIRQGWEMYREGVREAQFERREGAREAHDLAMEQVRAGRSGATGDAFEAPKMFEITNKQTGESREILGRVHKGVPGVFDAMSGQPIQFDPAKETIKEITASTAGGGRAGAQRERQIIAGGEVAADLKNIGNMPMGATTGWLGGLVGESGGISLMNAAKVDMANTLTDEDDVNMKIALGGLGRELSTLMSPVYGGEWASKQLEPMIPKKGYSITNSLYGIARIKQSALVALEGFKSSPLINKGQRDLADKYEAAINRDIPWGVADVIAFLQSRDPKETFKQYAGRSGVSGADAGKPADTGIPERPSNVPEGSAFSPSRNQWRGPDGKLYDAQGNPL